MQPSCMFSQCPQISTSAALYPSYKRLGTSLELASGRSFACWPTLSVLFRAMYFLCDFPMVFDSLSIVLHSSPESKLDIYFDSFAIKGGKKIHKSEDDSDLR
jgi:hypothetical protein